MVFSSMIFLWAFLPIVFILDKIAGKSRKLQNILLLAASLLFYAWGEPRYMWLPWFPYWPIMRWGFYGRSIRPGEKEIHSYRRNPGKPGESWAIINISISSLIH